MKLQKHEREALALAREMAPAHLSVEIAPQGHAKKRLVLSGPRGKQFRPISSSPGSREVEMDYTRRWLRKAIDAVS